MDEILKTIIDIITIDIFIGYGIYTLLYISISIFKTNIQLLHKLDANANNFIIFSGLIYFLAIMIAMIAFVPSDRLTRGLIWLQPIIWTTVSQLLWIKTVRKNLWLRFAIAMVFIASFQTFVIVVTSIHRDYLPGSWLMSSFIPTSETVIELMIKLMLFCLLASLFSWTFAKLKTIKS
jgi:hypothetical protein